MSKKTVKYILMFLGILIFLASYLLVYMDFTSKTDTLNTDISTLDAKFSTLRGYEASVPRFTDTIAQVKTAVGEALGKYGSSERPEDFIMLATVLEDRVGLGVTGMSFDTPAAVWTIAGVTDGTSADAPVLPLQLTCYKTASTISGSMNYEQIKQALKYISDQKDVTKLSSLTLSYDSSTGFITGEFALDKYFITGRDIPDKETVIPQMDLGKDILMGT